MSESTSNSNPGSNLPSLKDIQSNGDALARSLVILFEGSPTLRDHLVPQVATHLQQPTSSPLINYASLIDVSLGIITLWDDALQAQFIEGHPRIGEQKNLSHLSSKEQAAFATPPEVIARLRHLNACYEHRYPGLRYITFVNGRTRTMIKEELEDVLGLERSLSPDQPPIGTVEQVEVGREEWKKELGRAVGDVGLIAKSRLRTLGIE